MFFILFFIGILWAGRGHHRRSLIYFFSVKEFYTQIMQSNLLTAPQDRLALETLYTHNIFYLAQAYGNTGNAKLSAHYCFETLHRQYSAGFDQASAALEWVKNCQGISDFYLAKDDFLKCILSLLSAEKVLKGIDTSSSLISLREKESHSELEMDLQRRFIKFDVALLQTAQSLKYQSSKEVDELGEGKLPTCEPALSTFFEGLEVQLPDIYLPTQVGLSIIYFVFASILKE